MEEKPNYYSVIPADVRYNKNLRYAERLLYWEIVALSNKEWFCYATNSYFAKLYDVSVQTVSTWINNLAKFWFIQCNFSFKENTKEIEHRILIPIKEKFKGGIKEKFKGGIKEKLKDNNTRENNIKREYFEDDTLNTSFLEFIEHRKEIKAKMTDLAIEKLVNKIKKRQQKYTNMQIIAFIDESIENGWKWVFEREIKNEKKERTEAEKKEMFKFAEQITKMWNNNKTRADDLFF